MPKRCKRARVIHLGVGTDYAALISAIYFLSLLLKLVLPLPVVCLFWNLVHIYFYASPFTYLYILSASLSRHLILLSACFMDYPVHTFTF